MRIEETEISFRYILANEVHDPLPREGIAGINPSGNLISNLYSNGGIRKKQIGIHYGKRFNSEESFIVLGGMEEHYKSQDFIVLPLIYNNNNGFLLNSEGISIRKNGAKPKYIYGLQQYDLYLDQTSLSILFPLSILNKIIADFEQFDIYCYIDAEYTPGMMVCNEVKYKYPIISIISSGREVAIEP